MGKKGQTSSFWLELENISKQYIRLHLENLSERILLEEYDCGQAYNLSPYLYKTKKEILEDENVSERVYNQIAHYSNYGKFDGEDNTWGAWIPTMSRKEHDEVVRKTRL